VKVVRLAALAVLLGTGCARALHPDPSLDRLIPPGTTPEPARVDELLGEAERLFASRDPGAVRRASDLWLGVAAADPVGVDGLVGAARADIWIAAHAEDARERAEASSRAVQAAQICLRRAAASATCWYWQGAALGVQARERQATGLAALPEIERSFQRALELDPEIDHAGPERALALLYVRAPGWPTGPGDPDRAVDHARRAAARQPNYPPNRLALAETLRATEDSDGARREAGVALARAKQMQATAEPDASEWVREAEELLRGLGPS
jgi:tetratricopeptide (TPR) repeat protein